MTLLALAAECCAVAQRVAPLLLGTRRLPVSIDASCPHGTQQQTGHMPVLQSNDGTGGWTYRHLTDTQTLLLCTRYRQCR